MKDSARTTLPKETEWQRRQRRDRERTEHALEAAADKLDVIFRCVYNSRSAPNVLDTIRDVALWARDDARQAMETIERPQPRAEAETALTTAEDGTPHSPVPHVGAAATAENVAPKRSPSEPEPKPAADTTAAGSITGSAPAGGLRNEKKLPCGCYVAYGQGNTRGVWSISAVAFLCDKGHKQGDITEVVGA